MTNGFQFLIVLLLWGRVQSIVVDGQINSTDAYLATDRLTNSVNSEWYVQMVSGQICVGVQYNGTGSLRDVVIGLTFEPNVTLSSQQGNLFFPSTSWDGLSELVTFGVPVNFIIWCSEGTNNCDQSTPEGNIVSTIAQYESSATALEFCFSWQDYGFGNYIPVVYFQGRVLGDGSQGASSSGPGFHGLSLMDGVPAGLTSNWNTYPYVSNQTGDWNTVTWYPQRPPNYLINSPTEAAAHAILLANIFVSSTDVWVGHLTHLSGAQLTLQPDALIQIGYSSTASYWILNGGFSADSTARIRFWTPTFVGTTGSNSLPFPDIEVDSLNTANTSFLVLNGFTADTITMKNPSVTFTQSPSAVNTLIYQSSGSFTVGKEFPTNQNKPLTININSGASVSAYLSAGVSITVESINIQNGTFIYGTLNTSAVNLPVLNVTSQIVMNSTSRMSVGALLYATEISDNFIQCLNSDQFLIFVSQGSGYEIWPKILLEESDWAGVDTLQISEDTPVTIQNPEDFTNYSWTSNAAHSLLCNSSKCKIPAVDAVVTVQAVGVPNNCLTQKSFKVVFYKEAPGKRSNLGYIIGGVVLAVVVAVVAAVSIVMIRRRRKSRTGKDQKNNADLEMSPKQEERISTVDGQSLSTSYRPMQGSANPTATNQSLIDPKYEIAYKEITFGPELGRGAFGVVYKCRWRNTDTVVKQMDINKSDTASVDLFLKEAANVLKLRTHPNVCTVFGVCTDTHYPICILMEYLPDGSLDNLLYNNKIKIDVKTVLELARDVASGMGHLHAENVLHCDLACRNLLVTTIKDKHVVKIADFGLSRVTDKDTYNASTSSTFPIRWTAPETLRSGKISRASDIWSFGVVLWEIIEGKRPYPELSNTEVVKAVCDKGYRLPCPDRIEIPLLLWQLMQDCWSEDPTQRPQFDTIYHKLEEIGQEFWNPPDEVKQQENSESFPQISYTERKTDYSTTDTRGAVYGNQVHSEDKLE